MAERIQIIEDEEDISELMKFNLSKEGFDISCAHTGEEGLRQILGRCPDLVLLDLMLPGVDGLEICRRLKADSGTNHVPIVMVTAKGEEEDIVRGLEAGADDYISKPFSPKILMARVKAILRRKDRNHEEKNDVVEIGDLSIHTGRRQVLVGGEALELTRTEFDVLTFLAARPGWVFTRSQIVEAVQGPNHAITDRAVDVQMVGLRKKLGTHGELIETVRGVGYRFRD